MTKTIEERAREYANKQSGGEYHTGFEGAVWQESYESYKEIATEQRKIDIDKACEEFRFFLDRLVEKDIEVLRPEILQADVKVWYEDFKHIMEERQ